MSCIESSFDDLLLTKEMLADQMARMLFVDLKAIDNKEVKDIRRRLWLIIGVLEHVLDPSLLIQTYKMHKKLNTVPGNYDSDSLLLAKPL